MPNRRALAAHVADGGGWVSGNLWMVECVEPGPRPSRRAFTVGPSGLPIPERRLQYCGPWIAQNGVVEQSARWRSKGMRHLVTSCDAISQAGRHITANGGDIERDGGRPRSLIVERP